MTEMRSGLRSASLVAWNRADRRDAAFGHRRTRILGALVAAAGVCALALSGRAFAVVPISAGCLLCVAPGLARRVGTALRAASRALFDALGFAAMFVVFILVVAPLGALLRARRTLRIELGPDPSRASYFEARRAPKSDASRAL